MTTPPSDPPPSGPELPAPPSTPAAASDRPSRTMAGWALGLAIVPCCFGLTAVVGIVLGITVLVKSRNGVDHGKAWRSPRW